MRSLLRKAVLGMCCLVAIAGVALVRPHSAKAFTVGFSLPGWVKVDTLADLYYYTGLSCPADNTSNPYHYDIESAQTENGINHFVTANYSAISGDKQAQLTATATSINQWEQFQFIPTGLSGSDPSLGSFYLKSVGPENNNPLYNNGNGWYVTTNLGDNGQDYAQLQATNNNNPYGWEEYDIYRDTNSNDTFAIIAHNGLAVSADYGGTGNEYAQLRATAHWVQGWEEFYLSPATSC